MRGFPAAIVAVPLFLSATACTSIDVKPVDLEAHKILHICIRHNSAVIVHDLVQVLQEGLQRNAISSEIIHGDAPAHCEYVLRYTARQSWDFALYMADAELWLTRSGSQIGYANYHLRGGGGNSLMKWQGTKTKLDPVIDRLFGG